MIGAELPAAAPYPAEQGQQDAVAHRDALKRIDDLEQQLAVVTGERDDAVEHIARLEQRHEAFKDGVAHALSHLKMGGD